MNKLYKSHVIFICKSVYKIKVHLQMISSCLILLQSHVPMIFTVTCVILQCIKYSLLKTTLYVSYSSVASFINLFCQFFIKIRNNCNYTSILIRNRVIIKRNITIQDSYFSQSVQLDKQKRLVLSLRF